MIAPLCATVGLSIESANVVGYQTKDVRKNLSQQVCTFDQIGVTGGALDIQKLLPVDGEGNYVGDGAVNIQFADVVQALFSPGAGVSSNILWNLRIPKMSINIYYCFFYIYVIAYMIIRFFMMNI